jgi:hypothetical protein
VSDPEAVTSPLAPTTPEVARPGAAPPDQPQHIGRYRVERLLGQGSFGLVHLAHDEQLRRLVAIKVPRRQRVSSPENVEAYMAEARILASLGDPHIVPVFDVGSTDDGLCFVLSKYVEGSDLAQTIRRARPSFSEKDNSIRVWRGGTFEEQASNVRSATRFRNVPSIGTGDVGFRPARTFR